MLLQVQRVITEISRTETRWENAIEKIENVIQMRVRVRVKNSGAWRTQWVNLELQTPKTRRNNNNMIHNAQQCTAGYGAKRLNNLIQSHQLYPCFH